MVGKVTFCHDTYDKRHWLVLLLNLILLPAMDK